MAGSIPATTTLTWISLLVVVIGAFALAVWVFLRAQGVETWETTRGQRWTITLAIVAIVLLPVMLADTNYDNPAPRPNNAPAIQGLFSRAGSSLALRPGAGQPPARCCSTILNRDAAPLGTDERTRQTSCSSSRSMPPSRVTDLRIQIVGENGLEATADPDAP